MSAPTITVLYSCEPCGLKKIPVEVPARQDEDLKAWMDRTIRLVCHDHGRRSPHCRPKTLSNLMIPMTGADRAGGPTVN